MLRLYYKIWVDAIVLEQSKKTQRKNWKLYSLIPISLLQGVNLFTIFFWMKILVNKNLPLFFPVSIFSAKPLNSFISILITLFIPFVILNYLLIFNNDRYEDLLKRYEPQGGKLYRWYTLISIGILIIPALIVKLFFQVV
jgi:hypothetical protein